MRIEPHMSLKIWNSLEDPYDHEQQADNLAKIGAHDHSPGRGVLIPEEGLATGAITTRTLANEAVTPEKIASSVTILKELVESAVSLEVLSGQLIEATKTLTITLPVPTKGRVVAAFNKPAAETEETTVKKHGADKIYGGFIKGADTIKLAQYQWVVLEADGTNWLIIAGEPKREGSVVVEPKKLRAEKTLFKASAVRPALAMLLFTGAEAGRTTFFITTKLGGETRTEIYETTTEKGGVGQEKNMMTFELLAGEEWEWTLAGAATGVKVESTYVIR